MSDVPPLRCYLNYENEQQISFLRVDAATRKMFPFDTSRHVNEAARHHYQPIIDKLKKQIDEKLAQIGVENKLCQSEIDSHVGMKKEAGSVIQPNVIRPLS